MSAKTECDHCGGNCCGYVKLVENNSMFGESTLDFCRLTCLLDYLLEQRMDQLARCREMEANLELGLDLWGDLPEYTKVRFDNAFQRAS